MAHLFSLISGQKKEEGAGATANYTLADSRKNLPEEMNDVPR
jgi:hypothetical protein